MVECERTPGADCEGLPHGSIFVMFIDRNPLKY